MFSLLTKVFALKPGVPDMHSYCNLSSCYLCNFALGKLGKTVSVRGNDHAVLMGLFSLACLILSFLMFLSPGMHVGLYAGLQAELWQLC